MAVLLFLALFLLGYGWNLGFVAGSALLTHGLELAERTRLQGLTDALIWSSAAAASLGSGVVVAAARLHHARPARGGAGRRARLLVVARRSPWRRAAADAIGSARLAGTSSRTTQAARTRAQSSTSSSGTCSSALWATLTSPGPEDDARRPADVHEEPHVGAVRLAEQRRPAPGDGLDRVGQADRQRMVRRDARRCRTARRRSRRSPGGRAGSRRRRRPRRCRPGAPPRRRPPTGPRRTP